ncbi:major capsid protein [Auritidibacter ignavus]|uniref:Major capsid protein n=1 Tax=Auritidibacter ignavus TaxID=678932 RepID=A0AAJ6DE12_9MICC|nr:major capsid protein [Auritidibacter ignavus]WGH92098.1 major capsid protein [Auritidibacter ignavus]
MNLWTDIIDPATATGYAREELSRYEEAKGSLAAWLPNQLVNDNVVRVIAGGNGFVEEARYRAYDAEPEVTPGPTGKRLIVELPALGRKEPISEYNQLRGRNANDQAIQQFILSAVDRAVRSVADEVERMRGYVLTHGKAVIDQDNFSGIEGDFQRDADLNITAAKLWSESDSDPIGDLKLWLELYESKTGVTPGSMVVSRRVMTALSNSSQFQVTMAGGGSRPASEADVSAIIQAHGLPPVTVYTRRTKKGPVLPQEYVLFLPAPVDYDDVNGTELGGTFWGQTLSSEAPDWQIVDADRPGIAVGVYRNPEPPMIAHVIPDAISLPILANANLSLAAKVL